MKESYFEVSYIEETNDRTTSATCDLPEAVGFAGFAGAGWGSLPYFSQYSASGKLTFNAGFPAGVNTYRAYRLPWKPATSGR